MTGEPTGMVVVAARGITKSYETGGTRSDVLRGIDLDVHAGQFLSIMGPSGSGKSTLLHLLGGLDTPDDGDVHVGGHALAGLSDDDRTKLRRNTIGVVYQAFNLIPVLTVEENVALPAVIAGEPPASYASRRDELIDLVGLGDHRHKQPSELSGGQQQRVAVARALFVKPTVLLADEPTGNLDMRSGAEILDVFVQARDELGQTIVMVTHDPHGAAYGDEVLLLRDGLIADRLDVAAAAAAAPQRRRPLRVGENGSTRAVPPPSDPADPVRGITVLRWLERLDAGGAVRRPTGSAAVV